MKIAIIESRSFNDEGEFDNALAKLLLDIEIPLTVISGGASGADALAAKFAHKNDYPLIEYKQDW
ncbi:SLOG family protein [Methylotenera sp.]|uniref:SLOG family protein n=1 Tax=Methylotenera sp. TaxID=2051956 RepID=UPI00273728A7|nr:SLOG family protein [Methylotenera sp.]MDP3211940.1 SLOG family protein [Methylotenera sp.]